MRQNGQTAAISHVTRRALWAFCALTVGATSAMAQPREDFVAGFCRQAEETTDARDACIDAYYHAASRYITYGIKQGFLDVDGRPKPPKLSDITTDWRLMLGMPSGEPFNHCTTKFAFQPEGIDFRAIWACLVELDPNAAKMDQI